MPPRSSIVAGGLGWTAELVLTIVIILLPVASRAQTAPRALSATELLDMYGRGDADAAAALLESIPDTALEGLAKAIQKATPAWVSNQGPALQSRRRLAAATLALDLFHAGYQTEWKVLRDMVEWGCGLIQRNPAGEAEHIWFLASVAVLGGARDGLLLVGGAGGPGSLKTSQHLRHARQRFPDDGRWQLAEAVADELPLMSEGARDAPNAPSGQSAPSMTVAGSPLGSERQSEPARIALGQQRVSRQRVIGELEKLTSVPAIAAEAHVHAGYQLFISRQPAAALAHFKQAALSTDPYVRYLAFFYAGRLLDTEHQETEAETSYRLALEALPNVQSGAEALGTVLFLRGQRDEAYAVVDAAFAAAPRPPDPWRLYIFGDYRSWPELIRKLHAELKPRGQP
jgi:tetratricopeptide (TPR) repeat protein